LEYRRECYCGNALNAGSVATSQLDCKYSCMGNQSESCGGDSRLNLYEFGATSVPETIDIIYAYQGCYTEATRIRALTGKAYFNDSMTVEACATACTGFTWFGVEYGREVYIPDGAERNNVLSDNFSSSAIAEIQSTAVVSLSMIQSVASLALEIAPKNVEQAITLMCVPL
jgi:WSC domain